jgi:hypothetical protein
MHSLIPTSVRGLFHFHFTKHVIPIVAVDTVGISPALTRAVKVRNNCGTSANGLSKQILNIELLLKYNIS